MKCHSRCITALSMELHLAVNKQRWTKLTAREELMKAIYIERLNCANASLLTQGRVADSESCSMNQTKAHSGDENKAATQQTSS